MKKDDLRKNFLWNSIGSLFYASTSLFFLIAVTRINGIKEAGIFNFAFSNACLLYIVGIYAGRTYQVTEKSKDITDSDYIYQKGFTVLIMILIAIMFSIVKNYNLNKTIIVVTLVIFKSLDAICDSLYSVIQKEDRLYNVGISLFLKGLIGTITFVIIDLLTKNIIFSIMMLIFSYVLITIFYDFRIIKECNFKLDKFYKNNVVKIFKLGFWTFFFTILTQYLINSPKYAIDNYLTSDIQTVYGIIAMPATVLLIASSFLVQPFLVKISDLLENRNLKKINLLLLKILVGLFLIFIISELFLYSFGIEILKILYGLDLSKYLTNLLLVYFGAFVYGITIVMSNILIAMRKTMSQTIIFIITSIITCFSTNYLVKSYGIDGASFGYLVSMIILLILYVFIYIYIVKEKRKEYEKY